VRLFDLSRSPSGSELALFEKPEQTTIASFRHLIPSASSGTRHPQAICGSAQTSIAARGTHHDRDHRRALQFAFSGNVRLWAVKHQVVALTVQTNCISRNLY
jgi:hypothetical protein